MSRTLYLASNNHHKLQELQALLMASSHGPAWDLRLARELNPHLEWDEIGTTFAENAAIKARAVKALTNAAVLADDSGLEVEALNGAPGIYSSRYGGLDGDSAANNAKLLTALQDVGAGKRAARFVCVLCFIDEAGREVFFRGECSGQILLEARGRQGFGYDPLFLVDGYQQTMAEMSEDLKNSISHRRRAIDAFLRNLTRNAH